MSSASSCAEGGTTVPTESRARSCRLSRTGMVVLLVVCGAALVYSSRTAAAVRRAPVAVLPRSEATVPPSPAFRSDTNADAGLEARIPLPSAASTDPLADNSTGTAHLLASSDEEPRKDDGEGAVMPTRNGDVLRDAKGRIVNVKRAMDPESPNVFLCPRFRLKGNDADRKKIEKHTTKYTRYAAEYCESTGMMQMNVPQHTHLTVLNTIASLVRVPRGGLVLDWGCGCGTMLNFLHLTYNTTGIGLDMTEGAIKFARQHSQPNQTFCWMDGSDMSMFPTGRFDAIVSWGSVYHVRRTQVQCEIITHFVRMLKPGAVAFVGHIRTDKSQEFWKKGRCVPPNSVVTRLRDFKTFRQSMWKRNGFFSLVITKNRPEE